jgi:DNA-binding response OmpR family regulator
MRAVLRRVNTDAASSSSRITVGSLTIDQRTRRVAFEDQLVVLTPKEYDLLVCLASDAGAVRSREQLIREVWDENWWGSTKTLDVHIASLRKKLRPEMIETVRTVGYRIVADASSGQ